MAELDNLKNSYIASIQFGLLTDTGYENCKLANEVIHRFLEIYIDGSNYPNKNAMKQELKLLKKSLSEEIGRYYQRG